MLSRKRFFSILIIIFLSLSFLFINIKVLLVFATLKFENQETGTSADGANAGVWWAQTFNATSTHMLSAVYLYVARQSNPSGNFTVALRALDASKKPKSPDLWNSTVVASGISTSVSWVFFNGSIADYKLIFGTGYSIVCSCPSGNSSNYINIYYNNSIAYTWGQHAYSGNSGGSWTLFDNQAFRFELWGYNIVSVNNVGIDSTLNYASDTMFGNWSCVSGTLSKYIFGFNGSGSWVNDSAVTISGSVTVVWVNVTKTISVNIGDVIQWKQWVNDSSNNWGNTGLQNFTVTAVITFLVSSNGIFQLNGSFEANNTQTTYSSTTIIRLEALPNNSSYCFDNFSWSYGNSFLNRYNFTVVNSTSLWCYFNNGSNIYNSGYNQGYSDGNSTGYSLGYSVGYSIGYTDGLGNGTGTPYLVARFSLNNSAPYQNETLFYNGTLSSSSSNITSFDWNFGDGNSATGNTTTHKYALDGIFLVNLTVSSGSMFSTMLQNITVSATTLTITGLDGTFALLMILLTVCLVLCVFRVPLIGFVFSLFTVSFSAWALTDTLLPLYPMINVFIAVIGGICFYLNIQKFRDSNVTKKNTSKLARRF